MTTIHLLPLSRRTAVALLVATVTAVLLTFAVTFEPSSPTGDRSAPDGDVTRPAGIDDASIPGEQDGRSVELAQPALAPGEVEVATDSVGAGGDVGVAAPEVGTSTLALPALDAKIVRSGQLDLDVRRRDFEEVWGDTQSAAGTFGGYVLSASRSGADDGPRTGSITMRIPSARFDAAVDRLRDTPNATVERLDITSQDVTQEFVDVRSRLRHDRAVEGRLLSLLAQTRGVSEVLAVQTRLDSVQEQIEVSQGRLDYLEKLTSMSTLTATISAPAARATTGDDDPTALAEAFDDAGERFTDNVGSAIVWLGGALPMLVLLTLTAVIGRIVWRRNRRRNADFPGSIRVTDQT